VDIFKQEVQQLIMEQELMFMELEQQQIMLGVSILMAEQIIMLDILRQLQEQIIMQL
jgi:hypothetical protein